MSKYKTSWGDPIYTVRLPRPVIEGLKELAAKTGRTTSEIVRSLVVEELEKHGIHPTDQPIDGQLRIE